MVFSFTLQKHVHPDVSVCAVSVYHSGNVCNTLCRRHEKTCWNLQGILERLNAGEVVVGDGGYVMQLERRGYVKAGHWTPEAAVEHPEAGI